MSKSDLKTLITEIQTNKAKSEALQEALNTERDFTKTYKESVNELIDQLKEERKASNDIITHLKKQLNAPSLELYTGYNTEDQWEGGIRIVFRLNGGGK